MKLEKLAGCLITNNGKVLMVKEKKDRYWKIPSERVDENESLEDCAIRETEEETGKKVELMEEFGTYKYYFKGRKFQLTVYTASIIGEGNKKYGDTIDLVKWTPINEMAIGDNDVASNKLIYQELMGDRT